MLTKNLIRGAAFAAFALLMAGCSVSVGGDDDVITKAADAPVGECVVVEGGENAETITLKKSSCETDGLTFHVANVANDGAACLTENYSSVTYDDQSKVCLTPNFEAGSCYQVPAGEGTTLADYRKVACDATPLAGTVIYEVTSRTDTEQQCSEGELAATFEKPTAVSFCLAKQSQG